MRGSGTTAFTDPRDYAARLSVASINLVFTAPGDFDARLTWVDLPPLRLLRSRENLPRIAYISLAPEFVYFSFPIKFSPPAVWGGVELQAGHILFHHGGRSIHQRTTGPSGWGLISLPPEHLHGVGKTLTGRELFLPVTSRVLHEPATSEVLRLHAQACRMAETRPEMILKHEAVRALQHDLIHALINCLTAGCFREPAAATQNHAAIMVQFENALAARGSGPIRLRELCTTIGVPERTLRAACVEFLGMGPHEYARLRRLNLVRAALRRADPATASVAEIARQHGFSELGRFAAIYRAAFGEAPSASLARSASQRRDRLAAESA